MGAQASAHWYCRTDGDDANGGGYDPDLAGAGDNLCDAAAGTTYTTVIDCAVADDAGRLKIKLSAETWPANCVGNCIRLLSTGTYTAGYYWITARNSDTMVTLDSSPAGGADRTGGTGTIGGAFLGLQNLMAGGVLGLSNPAIATPLVSGNTIWLQGSGSDDPSTPDYDYRGSAADYKGYWAPGKNGTNAAGRISLIGYNGRPCLRYSGLLFLNVTGWLFKQLKFLRESTGVGWDAYAVTHGFSAAVTNEYEDVIVELNGRDSTGLIGERISDCEVRDSVGGAVGSQPAVVLSSYGGLVIGVYVDGVRGDGFGLAGGGTFEYCLANGCGRDGWRLSNTTYGCSLIHVTSRLCGGKGLNLTTAQSVFATRVLNSNLESNSGNGLHCDVGVTALNNRAKSLVNFNNVWNNLANYSAISAGDNDISVDPGYTDAANGDYAPGVSLKAQGFPGLIRGTATTSYVDLGAVQRVEPAGGGGGEHSHVFVG